VAPGMLPERIIADFEAALQQSIREVFPEPEVDISGCLFHYAKAGLFAVFIKLGFIFTNLNTLFAGAPCV